MIRGQGLVEAHRCGWPPRIGHPRPRRGSAKAAGLAYERSLAGALPGAVHGQWFQYRDAAGLGWCQVDVLVEGQREVLVMEVKYSWVLEAHEKLERLYLPVVRMALEKPAVGLVVARRLDSEMKSAHVSHSGDLGSALALARQGRACLHWLGSGHRVMEAAD